MRATQITLSLALFGLTACSGADTLAVQRVQVMDPLPSEARSDYDSYRIAREAALEGKSAAPATIPVTLPVKAPTASQIAPDPAPVFGTPGRTAGGAQPASDDDYAAACARFYTAKAAQTAFEQAGGAAGGAGLLDPDGDGYACDYRPESGL